ncbi:GPW/gp25 family protein [soil metagenome]
MKKDKSFLGQGWAFPPGFSMKKKTVITVAEDEDIQQSLTILLSTHLGERVMQPRFGCNLQHVVFEKADKTTLTYLRDTIETAIIYHEPRIKLIQITVTDEIDPEGKISLNISYMIRSTNTRSNMVFPFYISEATTRFF